MSRPGLILDSCSPPRRAMPSRCGRWRCRLRLPSSFETRGRLPRSSRMRTAPDTPPYSCARRHRWHVPCLFARLLARQQVQGICMKKLFFSAAAATIGLAIAAAPAAAQTLEKIKQRGTLIVGSKADYKPFGFRDPSGAIVGFEPDIAKLVADKLGVKLEIEPVVSSNRMQFLQQGK